MEFLVAKIKWLGVSKLMACWARNFFHPNNEICLQYQGVNDQTVDKEVIASLLVKLKTEYKER